MLAGLNARPLSSCNVCVCVCALCVCVCAVKTLEMNMSLSNVYMGLLNKRTVQDAQELRTSVADLTTLVSAQAARTEALVRLSVALVWHCLSLRLSSFASG